MDTHFREHLIASATNHYKLTEPYTNGSNLLSSNSNKKKLSDILKTFFSGRVFKPFVILTALFFFQNWTGFIATIFYGVTIFQVNSQIFFLVFLLSIYCLMYYECQTLSAGKKHDFNDEIWLYFSTFFDQIIRKFVPIYLHEFAFNYAFTIFFTHLRHD